MWCPPCRQAIPHLKDLYEQNREKGLVVIGIHTSNQGSSMADFAERSQIPYPVAVDVNNATINAFHVDSYPDYYLLDRKGNLRFADLKNAEADRTVQALLAEESFHPTRHGTAPNRLSLLGSWVDVSAGGSLLACQGSFVRCDPRMETSVRWGRGRKVDATLLSSVNRWPPGLASVVGPLHKAR